MTALTTMTELSVMSAPLALIANMVGRALLARIDPTDRNPHVTLSLVLIVLASSCALISLPLTKHKCT